MPLLLTSSSPVLLPLPAPSRTRFRVAASAEVGATAASVSVGGFPSFLPRAVQRIRDGAAIRLAKRIERVPVQTEFSKSPILSSCVRPLKQLQSNDPVVLLHGFDSSCLEWRYTYPLLEEAGLEAWAVDILGWGFSNLETRPPCDVASKREHLYQFWRSYIKRPMVLVGPSLGAAVAIDFAVNYPEAVSKLIFIGASVYAEGTRDMTRLPQFVPYAGVFILKSLPLRLFATRLAFNKIPDGFFDWVQIGRLHCLLPWWEDATVNFMISGGYNVLNQIKQVKQKCLVIWGEDDGIISNKEAYRLQQELPSAILRQVGQCGHIPHVEKPREAAKLVLDFLGSDKAEKYKDTTEAIVDATRAILQQCERSRTVRRVIHTGSVVAASLLREDGDGYKEFVNESCWTPLDLPYDHSNADLHAYVSCKTLSEKELLKYNEDSDEARSFDVVVLLCGLVGGDALLPYTPDSIGFMLSPLTGVEPYHTSLKFLQALLGSLPLVHVDDVCEAHVFCMERPSVAVAGGRYLCAAAHPNMQEVVERYAVKHPELKLLIKEVVGEGVRVQANTSKLVELGFEYRYGADDVLDGSVECGKRLGLL